MRLVEILKDNVAQAVVRRRKESLGSFPDEVTVDYELISLHEFDIHDCKPDRSILCDRNSPDRAATYINGTSSAPHDLLFIKYEEFINQFRKSSSVDWSKDLKRADYIVSLSVNNECFIIHELSIGNIKSKRSDAKSQFIGTINFLMKIPEAKEYIDGCTIKKCIVSARGCDDIKPSPRGIAAGFSRPYKFIPNPCEIKIPSLNKLDFTIWKGNIVHIA
ncbi:MULTISPECIES: hypothetical protein [Bacteroidales]|uniref:Uncharacterized protein n=1 Tax=Duncaniella freteri TaxID=2530391 RepID=A0A4Z0V4I8_9BACT|nr:MULTISPECIES: hypothetical protein [Bacteroidales]TGG39257.1 hypothetical protein EZ315_00450 [Duncaniella freteri]